MTNEEKADRIRLAAERVFEGEKKYSCHAIEDMRLKKFKLKYSMLFSPAEKRLGNSWLDNHWGDATKEELKTWRIWALCLFAAMAETGDL